MQTTTTNFLSEFRTFAKENGPSFVYGHLSAPYDGCFYLNVVAFVQGKYAYLATDLRSFPRYKRFVVEPPKKYEGVRELAPGCILAKDIDEVLSAPSYKGGLEIHPMSALVDNTPYALYGQVANMAKALGYDVKGQFKCQICETDLSEVDECHYLEGEYHGNGGIGIEVGAPVCYDCYCEQHCRYCGEDVEPALQSVDYDGHCVYCAHEITCSKCGDSVNPHMFYKAEEANAYRVGLCPACAEEQLDEQKGRTK
jgi:hypothetical protein